MQASRVRGLRWLSAALLAGGVVAGMSALAPHVAIDVRLAFVLAFAMVSAEILLVARLAPVPRLSVVAGLSGLGFAGLLGLRAAAVNGVNAGLLTLGLLGVATLAGAALGARIERAGHLAAVAAISAAADLWSVYDPTGPSAQLAASALQQPERLALFALPWPLLGTPHIAPVIGAGDIVFAALYLAAFERHGLHVARAVIGLAAGFALGLAGLLLREQAVPLLPLLGAGVLLADRRARSLAPGEGRTVLLVVAALGGLLAVRFLR